MPLSEPRSPLAAPHNRGSRSDSIITSSYSARYASVPYQSSLIQVSVLLVLIVFSALLRHSIAAAGSASLLAEHTCRSKYDHSNPLAERFPNNATGVLNATLIIIPISLETAREIIPAEYGILEGAYRALLPDFPEGMYPVLLHAAHDHDVQLRAYGITLEDFTRIGFEFPFLDLLQDGHTSFRWVPAQLLSATHDIALEGSRAYGTIVSGARWDPGCEAYRHSPTPGAVFLRGEAVASPATEFIELDMVRLQSRGPYPLLLFRNITNQPMFANRSSCGNMIRWFETSMSAIGTEFEPRVVWGSVRAGSGGAAWPAKAKHNGWVEEWTEVYGLQVATPFIENNYLECASMRGYEGKNGEGDSEVGRSWGIRQDVL